MDDDAERLLGLSLRDGRYVVSGVLGHGAQGETLEAVDKKVGRAVAIKRFQVRGARSWKDVELAEREADVLSRLEHRLLPGAIEHFEEDGALYLVMEKVDGQPLSKLGGATRQDVIDLLHDAADVLDYLHGRAPPVIHRDIKPSNVIRRRRPNGDHEYVLVDFGSVRATLEPKGGSTVVGTFGYMAPEQLQGRAMPATDVYAVGATALRMLTGTEPEDLPHRGLGIDVKKALASRGNDALVRALEAMLRPDPDERAGSIRPLLRDLPRGSAVAAPAGKQEARDRKRRRKRERRERDQRRRARPGAPIAVPPLLRPVLMIAFAVARLAVSLALTVAVPLLLTFLSILFGPALRRAAKAVTAAGHTADEGIVWARDQLLGQAGPPPVSPKRRIHVQPSAAPAADDGIDEAIAEAEAEIDQAVDDLRTEIGRNRRR